MGASTVSLWKYIQEGRILVRGPVGARWGVPLLCGLWFASPQSAFADSYRDLEAQEERRLPRAPAEREMKEERALEAGGLSAPSALLDQSDQRSAVEKELEEAERADSGRGLQFIWAQADLGYLWLNPQAGGELGGRELDASSGGLVYGAGLGVRVLYFTLGARFRAGSSAAWDNWSLGGELGMRIPLGNWEPYASLQLGYFALNQGGEAEGTSLKWSAGGFSLRPTVGLDYYWSDTFSLGVQVGSDVAFLSGTSESLGETQPEGETVREGSGIAWGVAPTLVVGFHF